MYMQDSAEDFAGGLSGFLDTLQQIATKVAQGLAPKPATPQVVYYLPSTGPTGGGGVYGEDYYPAPTTVKAATSTILGMSPLVLAGAGVLAIMLLSRRRR